MRECVFEYFPSSKLTVKAETIQLGVVDVLIFCAHPLFLLFLFYNAIR
jgi:hypothetical protein